MKNFWQNEKSIKEGMGFPSETKSISSTIRSSEESSAFQREEIPKVENALLAALSSQKAQAFAGLAGLGFPSRKESNDLANWDRRVDKGATKMSAEHLDFGIFDRL